LEKLFWGAVYSLGFGWNSLGLYMSASPEGLGFAGRIRKGDYCSLDLNADDLAIQETLVHELRHIDQMNPHDTLNTYRQDPHGYYYNFLVYLDINSRRLSSRFPVSPVNQFNFDRAIEEILHESNAQANFATEKDAKKVGGEYTEKVEEDARKRVKEMGLDDYCERLASLEFLLRFYSADKAYEMLERRTSFLWGF
jgi:predicted house-cleaning noncanonical NTP pyrophosphatase (MazG superfamily)